VDKGDTDIDDSAKHVVVVGIVKHALHAKHKGMTAAVHVMAWVGVMVQVAANKQAF
jgi:hypothetical protein